MKTNCAISQQTFDAEAAAAGTGTLYVAIVDNGVDQDYLKDLAAGLQNAGFKMSIFNGGGLPGVVNTLGHAFTNIDIANAVKIAEIATAISGANALGFAYPNLGYLNLTEGNFVLNLVPKQS